MDSFRPSAESQNDDSSSVVSTLSVGSTISIYGEISENNNNEYHSIFVAGSSMSELSTDDPITPININENDSDNDSDFELAYDPQLYSENDFDPVIEVDDSDFELDNDPQLEIENDNDSNDSESNNESNNSEMMHRKNTKYIYTGNSLPWTIVHPGHILDNI